MKPRISEGASKAATGRDRPLQALSHEDSSTFTYVVHHANSAVIIDPVLDYDAASVRTSTTSVDAVIAYVRDRKLRMAWILETHAHADHLSAGDYLRDALGAPLAIGGEIVQIRKHFNPLFNLGDEFVPDGQQFDRLLQDGDELVAGELSVQVLATPGHTQDGLTYLIGGAAFVGDTIFAPENGTARCNFPGGDLAQLYHSRRSSPFRPVHVSFCATTIRHRDDPRLLRAASPRNAKATCMSVTKRRRQSSSRYAARAMPRFPRLA